MTHPRNLALPAVLVALIAGALVWIAPQAGDAAAARTAVTIQVHGCNGCELTPVNFRTQRGYTPHTVRSGLVRFTLPSGATRGLGFLVTNSAPHAATQARYLAVARYRGKAAGRPVSATYAAHAGRATQCWAGTSRSRTTLKLTVRHFAGTSSYDGSRTDEIRPYFSPTLRSLGTPWRTHRGQLATQSVIDCSGNYPG